MSLRCLVIGSAIVFFASVIHAERSKIEHQALETDPGSHGHEHCKQWSALKAVLQSLGIDGVDDLKRWQIIWSKCEVEQINLPGHEKVHGALDERLGELTSLQILDLRDTEGLAGSLSHLQGLTNLIALYLSGSHVAGDLSSLRNLTELNTLVLDGTNITGDLSSLRNRTKLRWLQLDGTKVTGDLSSLRASTGLFRLGLSNTQVVGDLSDLHLDLEFLDLSHTAVAGKISGLQKLTKMSHLALSDSDVSGDISSLKALSSLKQIDLSHTIVAGDMAVLLHWKQITSVKLEHAKVSGRLNTSWLGKAQMLRTLKLSYSEVSFLPAAGDKGDLEKLLLLNSLEEDVTWLPQLNMLELSGCPLQGDVMDLLWLLRKCPNIASIKATNSRLTGSLRSLRGQRLARSLQTLDLAANNVSEIDDLPENLQVLILTGNPMVRFADGVLRRAVKAGTFLDLQNVELSNKAEARELVLEGLLNKTPHNSSDTAGGYSCYSIESTSLQVTPALFLPDELCSCSPGFAGRGVGCTTCPSDTYAEAYGTRRCTPCPKGSTADESKTSCRCLSGGTFHSHSSPACQCSSGHASNVSALDEGSEKEVCVPCHTNHLVCSEYGMHLISAPPEVGFARLTSNDTVAVACLPPKDIRCNSSQGNGLVDSECGAGYRGILCSDCQDSHYFSNKLCEPCPDEDQSLHSWQVAALAAGVAVIGLVLACLRMRWTSADAEAPFSAMDALKEQLKQQAPVLLQTCQLWAVLALLMQGERQPEGTADSSWEVPFVEASQLSVASLKGALNLQCKFHGATVRWASAVVAPVAPMVMLLFCVAMEFINHGFGIAAALKASPCGEDDRRSSSHGKQFEGSSGAHAVLRGRRIRRFKALDLPESGRRSNQPSGNVDVSKMAPAFAVLRLLFGLLGRDWLCEFLLLRCWCTLRLGLLVHKAAFGPSTRQDHGGFSIGGRESGAAIEHGEGLFAGESAVNVARCLLAASASHIAIRMKGHRVRVVLKDGMVIATMAGDASRNDSSDHVTNLLSIVGEVDKKDTVKSRELAEAMMDRYLLEEAESSDRALAGSKSFLAKYTRFRSLYMEIIQKLVAVALVSVVGSEDGLQLTLAITLLMAAASGMIQPFLQPQVNILQCGCFICLAVAAVSFSFHKTWLSRVALVMPFLLSAILALRPDSTESLAVRIWQKLKKEILKLEEGESVEILVDTATFI